MDWVISFANCRVFLLGGLFFWAGERRHRFLRRCGNFRMPTARIRQIRLFGMSGLGPKNAESIGQRFLNSGVHLLNHKVQFQSLKPPTRLMSSDMAITNHERVGKALDLLKAGLGPFVDREVRGALESRKVGRPPSCATTGKIACCGASRSLSGMWLGCSS